MLILLLVKISDDIFILINSYCPYKIAPIKKYYIESSRDLRSHPNLFCKYTSWIHFQQLC